MKQEYAEDDFINEDLTNDELFHLHVAKGDTDLVKIDQMLGNVFEAEY